MFDASRVAALMVGELKTVSIDVRECVESTGPGSSRIHMEKLPSVLDKLVEQWPEIKEEYDSMNNNVNGFRLDSYLSDHIVSRPDLYMTIGEINVTYPDRSAKITVHRKDNIIKLRNAAEEFSSNVIVENRGEHVTIISSTKRENGQELIRTYLCYDCVADIEPNSTVPSGIKLKTPIRLEDNKVKTGIVAVDGKAIEVYGEVTVEDIVPIIADGIGTVVIRGDGRLTLVCTESMQPCIGTRTATGLSYGRWEPMGVPPKKIIVDGAEVICSSQVDNFALGKYGSEFVPEIELVNGGKLVCPETSGERIVVKHTKAPEGSTKVYGSMEYAIFREGMLTEEFLSPEAKILAAKLPEKARKSIQFNTQVENLTEAVRLSSYKKNIDVSIVLDGSKRLTYAVTCALLRNAEMYSDNEYTMESNKIEFLIHEFADRAKMRVGGLNLESEKIVQCMIILTFDRLVTSMSDYACEVLYEMIPSYFFDGWVKGNKRASLQNYINESVNMRQKAYELRDYIADGTLAEIYEL